VLAGALLYPCQISLESALAYHGLIPEAVGQVSAVTSARSRTFVTPMGSFAFVRVPCNDLRAGVRALRVQPDRWAYVSSPLRAIADLVYTRREVRWRPDGIAWLTESLRIDMDDLRAMSWQDMGAIGRSLRNKRTRTYLEGLQRELGR